MDSLINTLISFSGLFNRILSFDVARKGWPSLHVLLPWLLDVGVVAVKKDNTVHACILLFMIGVCYMYMYSIIEIIHDCIGCDGEVA